MGKQDKLVFSSAAIIFLGLLTERAIRFVAKVLIARYLGSADYGLIVLGSTTLSILSYIAILGLDTGVSRYLPRFNDPQKNRGLLVSAFLMAITVSTIIGLFVLLFSKPLAIYVFRIPQAVHELRIFAIAIPFAVLISLSIGMVRGTERSLPRAYIENISLPVSRFALIAVVILMGGDTVAFAWSYTLSFALTSILSLYFMHKYTRIFDFDISIQPEYRSLLAFSVPLVVSGIMYRLLTNLDKFLLGYFTGSSSVIGKYDVVYTLASMLLLVLSAFGYISLPTISKLDNEKKVKEIQKLYNMVTKWIFILTLPVVLVAATFANTIIQMTFGVEYTGGSFTFQILALGFFTHTLAGPNVSALQSIGRTKTVLAYNTIIMVLNIILNILLIPSYGMLGAGIATTVSYISLNVLSNIRLYRDVRIQPISREIIFIGLTSSLTFIYFHSVLNVLLPESFEKIIVIAILFGVLYSVLVFKIAIGERELDLVKGLVARFK